MYVFLGSCVCDVFMYVRMCMYVYMCARLRAYVCMCYWVKLLSFVFCCSTLYIRVYIYMCVDLVIDVA